MNKTILAACLSTLVLGGCAFAPSPLMGVIYSDVLYPREMWHGQEAAQTGESCAYSVLGLFAGGDASLDAAKRDAGITEVSTVDHRAFNVLVIYSSFCTVVKGK